MCVCVCVSFFKKPTSNGAIYYSDGVYYNLTDTLPGLHFQLPQIWNKDAISDIFGVVQ